MNFDYLILNFDYLVLNFTGTGKSYTFRELGSHYTGTRKSISGNREIISLLISPLLRWLQTEFEFFYKLYIYRLVGVNIPMLHNQSKKFQKTCQRARRIALGCLQVSTPFPSFVTTTKHGGVYVTYYDPEIFRSVIQ